jgi:uncharacterized protein YcfL
MRLISLTLLGLMIIGCTDRVRAPIEGRSDPYRPAQVHFDSTRLARDTAIGQPNVTRDPAGILYVSLPIRSTTRQTLYVDYRVTFFDRNGQVLSRLGPFTKTLDPQTPDIIEVNSSSPQASDFQIDLRYAR